MSDNSHRKFILRWTIVAVLITATAVSALAFYYRWLYPYGHRVGCMPNTMGALSYYAREHQGWYPRGSETPLQALRVFHPDYLGGELAGLTGNINAVLQRLRTGQPIDESVSSWVYQPGFRLDDDPGLAIIWERRAGVTVNGQREEGHAVGFANGDVKQVSDEEWASFLEKQTKLRREALAKRVTVGLTNGGAAKRNLRPQPRGSEDR